MRNFVRHSQFFEDWLWLSLSRGGNEHTKTQKDARSQGSSMREMRIFWHPKSLAGWPLFWPHEVATKTATRYSRQRRGMHNVQRCLTFKGCVQLFLREVRTKTWNPKRMSHIGDRAVYSVNNARFLQVSCPTEGVMLNLVFHWKFLESSYYRDCTRSEQSSRT